jgi:RNA polymerase sigma factor (sigma-70 family)
VADGPITIFVVDDDESVRISLGRLLRSKGLRCEAFPSAADFLRRPPHVGLGCLILDISMPELDGLELQQLINERGQKVPVVFLTGHGDIPMSVQAMRHGAVDFLTKPVDEQTLLVAIERALGEQRQRLQQRQRRADLQHRLDCLSPREREVLRHLLTGARNRAVAETLGIAEKTVKVHRARILEKMAARSMVELVRAVAASDLTLSSPD